MYLDKQRKKKGKRIGDSDSNNKNQEIGIEFCMEKCSILKKKSRRRQITEGIELPSHEIIRKLGEKENYKYLEILETSNKRR